MALKDSTLAQLQGHMQDTLRSLATGQGKVEDVAPTAFKQLLPDLFSQCADKQPARADTNTKNIITSVFRKLVLDLALEAQAQGQPPMQYVAPRAAEPAIPRLMALALLCSDWELMEPANVITMLDDLQEVCTNQHCLDIMTWLEDSKPVLASQKFTTNSAALQQATRLCNSLLKRLGKHEVVSKSRLLMLIASITPLFDRSGVGVAGAFAPPDPPQAEEVPEGAVDSTGKPVDKLLYNTFWGLQGMLQDPIAVLNSMDKWATFKKNLSLVLEELAKAPATVPAARTAAAAGPGAVEPAAAAAAADMAAAEAAERVEGAGTQCYLSSYRLFGLQLTDSAFRRDFLVQVLIMLRTLLIPGKVPTDSLKPKQRMEALALEKEVYKVLEATTGSGKDFCRAVRDVLEREVTWVAWKKGGKDFVVEGKQQDIPAAAGSTVSGAAAAAAAKKPGPTTTSCIDWSKPPHPSIAEAVGKARDEAAKKAEQRKRNHVEGLELKREYEQVGRQYDNLGEPPERGAAKRTRYLRLLDNGSSITFWAAAKVADRSLAHQPYLAGLKVSEQQQYPTPEAVCAQVLREMDPDAGIDLEYRRVYEDPVYRWRLGRVVMQGLPEKTGVENPDNIEKAMMSLLPDRVPEGYKKQHQEEDKKKTGDKGVKPEGGRDEEQGTTAAAAADAGAVANGEEGVQPAVTGAEAGPGATGEEGEGQEASADGGADETAAGAGAAGEGEGDDSEMPAVPVAATAGQEEEVSAAGDAVEAELAAAEAAAEAAAAAAAAAASAEAGGAGDGMEVDAQ